MFHQPRPLHLTKKRVTMQNEKLNWINKEDWKIKLWTVVAGTNLVTTITGQASPCCHTRGELEGKFQLSLWKNAISRRDRGHIESRYHRDVLSEAQIHIPQKRDAWNNITTGHHGFEAISRVTSQPLNLWTEVLDMHMPARVHHHVELINAVQPCPGCKMRGIDMVAAKYCDLGISCIPWRQFSADGSGTIQQDPRISDLGAERQDDVVQIIVVFCLNLSQKHWHSQLFWL